ncbi:AT-rich interactive domain-containing protein 1-like [Cynara cardunculus var. scolymus]|uniref:ELM2 domain-containing protein n=1 Tax=Cynara cardunculus var. scolymus TaxID=59895 RepID=A0A103XPW0_CYNCS|nr:AT-rich interactive domain-containing protein 1-like [Cynara cardunculus var. scolymus]XP_024981090.1 AT-rich interactive domain-containing protein 1-like [Cynara cardunculus var. scolymus]XP_024981091.1 AT-rich interactive domain-containing protein 1-like [Cynara cardunculus var. scolymus]KVH94683.1 hypothetical protein Ccrd_003258 [Cynara cardunculus var. scolymus]
MKKPKHQKSATKDRFSFLLEERQKLVIPIGPRFQADVPEWNGPPQRKYPHKNLSKSDSSKFLGTVICSKENTIPETDRDAIGRGRPDCCDCYPPGSILCVKRHIAEKRAHLQKELGPAFRIWKFDEMGEAVAEIWKQSEQQKFVRIVKTNPISEGKNFLKSALECFPSKSHNTIMSYYFNVYLPRRISIQTRSGCTLVDTDDGEDEKTPCSKGSRKRAQVDHVGLTSKNVKVGYLTGRR